MEQLITLLRDAALGAVIGLVGLVLMAVGLKMSRHPRKRLAYQVMSFEMTPLGAVSAGNTTQRCRVLLRLWNAGNTSIVPDDYVHAVKFGFSYWLRAKIYDAKIVASSPPDIKKTESPTVDANELILPAMLLNAKDAVTLEVWISPPSGFTVAMSSMFQAQVRPSVTALARIIDVKQVEQVEQVPIQDRLWEIGAIVISTVAIGLIINAYLPHHLAIPGVVGWALIPSAAGLLALKRRLFIQWYLLLLVVVILVGLAYRPRKKRATEQQETAKP